MNYGSEGGVERIVTAMPDLAAMSWEPGGGGDHPMMEGRMLSGANPATSPYVPPASNHQKGGDWVSVSRAALHRFSTSGYANTN